MEQQVYKECPPCQSLKLCSFKCTSNTRVQHVTYLKTCFFFSFIVEHSNVPVLVYTFTPTGSQSTLGITSLSGCNL